MGLGSAGRTFALTVAVALAAPAAASADTLHDQLDNQAAGLGSTTPSYFYPSGDDDQGADDFTVPAGQAWAVTGAQAPGIAAPGTFEFRLTLLADAGGKPGGQVSQTQSTIPATGALYTLPISAAPQLGPGHYWISIQLMNLATWEWTNRTVQSGSPAVWRSDEGENGCPDWTPRTTCFPATSGGPDQAFSLQGTATPVPASVKKKKCKKAKKKHKRSAVSAKKKKCKKKKKKRR